MLPFSRLFTATTLAVLVSGAALDIIPPSLKGPPNSVGNVLKTDGTRTDIDTIVSTIANVDQKSGPSVDAAPNLPVAETVVTAVDGELSEAGTSSSSTSSKRSLSTRAINEYNLVFSGTGTGPTDRDASIEGTAYLTFTIVSNSTYNVDECLNFCSSIPECVFANLYYEFNNYGLDFVAQEKSNLKCAVYGDVHTAAEKTNFGNQQSYPPPAPLIYIQQSSGYALKTVTEPGVPDGYELDFGPINAATDAPGYLGAVFFDKYDVDACAQACNQHAPNANGGLCQYFNIFRAELYGLPRSYGCSMFYIATDKSTATITGPSGVGISDSRGYKRVNFVVDGGFEEFAPCDSFCFDTSSGNWIGASPSGGSGDATIFHYGPYAHSGESVALLGAASGEDDLAGTLTPAQPLRTIAGKRYQITFFQSSAFAGPTSEEAAWLEVFWNEDRVAMIRPGYSEWSFYSFEVTARGNDVLAFHGGQAPAWTFLDDIAVWQL